MKPSRESQARQYESLFKQGRPLERLYPIYEAIDTFLFTPGEVTQGPTHVRDAVDLKRMTIIVVAALVPCTVWAMYNTGYQAALKVEGGAAPSIEWQASLFQALGWGYDHTSIFGNLFFGALMWVPIFFVTLVTGVLLEAVIAVIRKRAINEAVLVTCTVFSLGLPAGIPASHAALGMAFGIVVGTIPFGAGRLYHLNSAIAGRAFLFFAFPARMPTAGSSTDILREGQHSWMDAFLGVVPGAMGETSVLCCLLGAAVLIVTGLRSWRTMAGCAAGAALCALAFNAIGPETNPEFSTPFYWHWVVGGFAFGAVFLATDPASSAVTNRGKFVHGFGVGVLLLLIRAFGSAGPADVTLAILVMSAVAPLTDSVVVWAKVRRRLKRIGA